MNTVTLDSITNDLIFMQYRLIIRTHIHWPVLNFTMNVVCQWRSNPTTRVLFLYADGLADVWTAAVYNETYGESHLEFNWD